MSLFLSIQVSRSSSPESFQCSGVGEHDDPNKMECCDREILEPNGTQARQVSLHDEQADGWTTGHGLGSE